MLNILDVKYFFYISNSNSTHDWQNQLIVWSFALFQFPDNDWKQVWLDCQHHDITCLKDRSCQMERDYK